MQAYVATHGRSPSPHLRGNPRLAEQMRSELRGTAAHSYSPEAYGAHPPHTHQSHSSHSAPSQAAFSQEQQASMHEMLESMGFTDKSVNAALLQKHDYQVKFMTQNL